MDIPQDGTYSFENEVIYIFSTSQIVVIINLTCILTVLLLDIIFLICNYKSCIKSGVSPLVFGVIKSIKESTIKKQKVYETIQYLNVCEDSIKYTKDYYCKKYTIVIRIFLAINILSIVVIFADISKDLLINQYNIEKPYYNEPSQQVELDVRIIDKNGLVKKESIDIDVMPNRLNSFEEGKLIGDVREYLDKTVLGANKSYDKVYTSLKLVERYVADRNIEISYETDELGIIDYKGDINYDYLKKKGYQGVPITVTAIIRYFENEYKHPIDMVVYQKEEDAYTKLKKALRKEIMKLNNEHSTEGELQLPASIDGYTLEYSERKKDTKAYTWWMVVSIGVLCIVIIIKYKDSDFKKDIAAKNEQLIYSYSGIVSKLRMYVIAGMSIEQAWNKLCEDYIEERDEEHIQYAYEEMLYTSKDIEVGTSSIEAFTHFGKRVGIGAYIRLSSLIIQNIKNGTDNFIDALELEIRSIESKQKELYIKEGGKLGTKLLLPMMLMMAITLGIVMLPALMSM